MTEKRLLEHDPYTGITITHEFDEMTGLSHLHYHQDVEDILNLNKEKQNAGAEYYKRDPDMWKVASIPLLVQFKWLTEKGVDVYNPEHADAVKKLLNDPEWKYLKTAEIIL